MIFLKMQIYKVRGADTSPSLGRRHVTYWSVCDGASILTGLPRSKRRTNSKNRYDGKTAAYVVDKLLLSKQSSQPVTSSRQYLL
jgi:hypothetical protein